MLATPQAVIEDVPALLRMLHESAEDQGFPDEVVVSEADLEQDGFGAMPTFSCHSRGLGWRAGRYGHVLLQLLDLGQPLWTVSRRLSTSIVNIVDKAVGKALMRHLGTSRHGSRMRTLPMACSLREPNPPCRLYKSLGADSAEEWKLMVILRTTKIRRSQAARDIVAIGCHETSNPPFRLVAMPWPASAADSDFPNAQIASGSITAKFLLPGRRAWYYRGTRFDWSGEIQSLKTKEHEYFGQWFPKYDPKLHDAIMGPVEEFLTDEMARRLRRSAKAGGEFIRIGVGALRKPDERRLNASKRTTSWTAGNGPSERRQIGSNLRRNSATTTGMHISTRSASALERRSRR